MNGTDTGLWASVPAKIQNRLNSKAEKLRLDNRNTFQFRTCTRLWKMLLQSAINLTRDETPFYDYVEKKTMQVYNS